MPPHLHPRSTATSTLFTFTLVASFAVVAVPHIFPCPRPRRVYADSERQIQLDSNGNLIQTPKAKRRRKDAEEGNSTGKEKAVDVRVDQDAEMFRQFAEEAKVLERERHECPVPKPDKVLKRLLGLQEDEKGTSYGKVKFRGDSRPDI